jgi:pimeloyl-ACP methyl ester carboxylesterase
MDRIPVYFVPGLGANTLIFEGIKLPEDIFECHYLEWLIPVANEPFRSYAARMANGIKHTNPVLIGVSFGGLVVQEMADIVDARRVIIISSAKSFKEFPNKFWLARKTGLHKLIPESWLIKIEKLARFHFTRKIDKRLQLYKRYLGVRDKYFWHWAIEQVVKWKRDQPDPQVIHIHGDRDHIFPARYIKNYISVAGGTHIMLVVRCKWFNENLPDLIIHGKLKSKENNKENEQP